MRGFLTVDQHRACDFLLIVIRLSDRIKYAKLCVMIAH